jgi:arylsulfatase A-like enzyme
VQPIWKSFHLDRKDAAMVHREFLDWLSRRGQPERPFFAFLNDYDAHWPYWVPEPGIHRFGSAPGDDDESDLIQEWWRLDKGTITAAHVAFARDAYDDCVAHLDEQLGRLVDELGRRGLRERTWIIVVADHGESFGEHAGVFCHGTSLYRTELHVPLLVVPPSTGRAAAGLRVAEPVSLRDLAATIVDLAGMGAGSPFPGGSLARCWDGTATGRPAPSDRSRALSEVVPNDQLDRDRVLEPRPPLAALSDGEWTYIRREGEVREELYQLADDPAETRDRAADPEARPRLERMRAALGRLTEGPLTPGRFNP